MSKIDDKKTGAPRSLDGAGSIKIDDEQMCDDTSCEYNENGICRAGCEEHCGWFGDEVVGLTPVHYKWY